MADLNTRIAAMADAIFPVIVPRFETGDDGELLLTCPFDGTSSYDIYEGDNPGTWVVILDDEDDAATGPDGTPLQSVAAAQRLIASLMAMRLIKTQGTIDNAARLGIEILV
ncbi:hypothetical protein ACOI1H_14665 [Loktanella sp. DJP18]|uniref:hypothetical protein n=1 Tax=Loktanella sp. DJP18 TaxID=3409788 RepID=UPI003BB777A9